MKNRVFFLLLSDIELRSCEKNGGGLHGEGQEDIGSVISVVLHKVSLSRKSLSEKKYQGHRMATALSPSDYQTLVRIGL